MLLWVWKGVCLKKVIWLMQRKYTLNSVQIRLFIHCIHKAATISPSQLGDYSPFFRDLVRSTEEKQKTKMEHIFDLFIHWLFWIFLLNLSFFIYRRTRWQRSSLHLWSSTPSPRTSPTTTERAITPRGVQPYGRLSLRHTRPLTPDTPHSMIPDSRTRDTLARRMGD